MLVVSVMSAAQHEEDSRGGLAGGGAVSGPPVTGAEVLSHSRSDQNHHSSCQSVGVPMHSLLFIITVQPTTALLISPVTAAID